MRRRDEHGQVTAFVAGLGMGLIALAGGIYDGGQVVDARMRALAEAEGAARAGAQAISVDVLRATGRIVLDPVGAHAKALDYLARFGHEANATVTVTDDRVKVDLEIAQPLDILRPLGPITVRGSGTARARVGVTEAGP